MNGNEAIACGVAIDPSATFKLRPLQPITGVMPTAVPSRYSYHLALYSRRAI